MLSIALWATTIAGAQGPVPRTEVARPQELWRVGEDDSEVVFGMIGECIVDRDGRLYVLDRQANQVSAFSHEGEFLRTIGRIGEGPGEFREPRGLVLLPDGDRKSTRLNSSH